MCWPLIALVGVLWTDTPRPALTTSQDWPTTRAERTRFAETSTYDDVIRFIEDLAAQGAPITIEYIGTTTEGRRIPLVIASRPRIASPAAAKKSGKPIVYIQGNIHAGEVEGKEAALALLRRYSREPKGVLDKVILLVNPIYNADGNEKFGPGSRNRPGQNGPDTVGQRANGQGLDLNRDAIKAESPEMRAALNAVYNRWDPQVMLDLHTTNGTRHAYPLTFSPPLNPNTHPAVLALARDQLLPAVRSQLAKRKIATFDYGNAERRNDELGWYTYGHEGRYVTNYAGLRNRIGILSEAFVHLPFAERVRVTEAFVDAVVRWVADHPRLVMEATSKADEEISEWHALGRDTPTLGVRFEFASRGQEPVLLEKAPKPGDPRPNGPVRSAMPIRMPVYDRFSASAQAQAPTAYLIDPLAKNVVALLLEHGIRVDRLVEDWEGYAWRFNVTKLSRAAQAFQGHNLITLDGQFESGVLKVAPGEYVVRLNQPLGALAFHILEPQSTDGAAAWGFFGSLLREGQPYPVYKCVEPFRGLTLRVRERP
jgi:hypothetical protein